jgi:hypothetical protein
VFGASAFGESAYGETAGAAEGIGAVDGVMHIVEDPDIVSFIGHVPVVSIAAIADSNKLVFVLEIELGQLGIG